MATEATAVIFNPTARGEKATAFRAQLESRRAGCRLLPTRGPGDARTLALEAVRDGATTLVAAGGDGTVNEVLNGLADAPDGLARARLAVVPLGTVNVFAKELGIPADFAGAWRVLEAGRERVIDLPRATFGGTHRWFAQMAGAGLDARALELVRWELKKKIGPLAYVWAGTQAMHRHLPSVTAEAGARRESGQLVLIGNGRFYGGRYPMFPDARLDDGLLDVALVPRVNWLILTRLYLALLRGRFREHPRVVHFQAPSVRLCADPTAAAEPFQVEGDNVGSLPAEFSVRPSVLRLVVP